MPTDRNKELADREDDPLARLYANHMEISHTMSAVLLDFGQFSSTGEAPVFHTRLITSPFHLHAFYQMMGGTLMSYETTFGLLPTVVSGEPEH